MNAILVGATLGFGIAIVFALLFWSLLAPKSAGGDSEWLRNFSAQKYRPMERLLSEDDYDFLTAQPGYQPWMAKKLRADRRRILGTYLRSLSRDFNRLYEMARLLVLYAPQDRPDLSAFLFKQKLAFVWSMLAVRSSLALQAWGLRTSVNLGGLVRSLELMRAQIPQLAAGGQRVAG